MSWQNKYRPRRISDLQSAIVREKMQRLLSAGKLPSVMLFAGPKGTGKTSTARIIAAILNSASNEALVKKVFLQRSPSAVDGDQAALTFQEPDLNDDQVLKIIAGQSYLVQEIDAASNSRVEDIRQLQDQIFLPPSMSQVSVFIFDEVHMLSNSAFNALLKTLEEPPAHCIFVLATTELHKIPGTIVSRCSLIEFQKATPLELEKAFQRVLEHEKISADPAALQRLAVAADGSFRDGIKLLELAALSGKIDQESLDQVLHTDLGQQLPQLLNLITQAKDEAQIVNFFGELRQNGVDEIYFLKAWLNFLYHQLQLNLSPSSPVLPLTTFKIAHFLLQQTSSTKTNERQLIPFLSLELKCLELVMKAKKDYQTEPLAHATSPSVSPPPSTPPISPPLSQPPLKPALPSQKNTASKSAVSTLAASPALSTSSSPKVTAQDPGPVLALPEETSQLVSPIKENWSALVKIISEKSHYLAAIFQLAEVQNETITHFTLGLGSNFHCDMMKQAKNNLLFLEAIKSLGLPEKKIEYVVLQNSTSAPITTATPSISSSSNTGYQSLKSEVEQPESAVAQAVLAALS